MDEIEEEDTDRIDFQIDRFLVVTRNAMDIEGMVIYKAHIIDVGMHFTGYGKTRVEAAVVALNKCAG